MARDNVNSRTNAIFVKPISAPGSTEEHTPAMTTLDLVEAQLGGDCLLVKQWVRKFQGPNAVWIWRADWIESAKPVEALFVHRQMLKTVEPVRALDRTL